MKPHLFLRNPGGEKKKFEAGRRQEDDKEEIAPKSPQSYRPQKTRLDDALIAFNRKRATRIQERSLKVPVHLEYIRIDFFVVFDDNGEYRTRSRFLKQYGLAPVVYTQFNQSVLFAITNEEKFKVLISLLNDFINSDDNTAPGKKSYAITTLIYDLEFISTADLLKNAPQRNAILSLVGKEETISGSFIKIYESLIGHLQRLKKGNNLADYLTDGVSSIELKGINAADIKLIAENFDIIYNIQSLRTPTIRPDNFNVPGLVWDFSIRPPDNPNVVIGVLDNGVKAIKPLEKILLDLKLDITNSLSPNAMKAEHPHGTMVAALAAVGLDFFDTRKKDFLADANILPIKILNFTKGYFNIYDIRSAIIKAVENGVRIFNLSVCGPGKMYNSMVSEYAYMLDKLAYEHDILIFIATGNLDYGDVEAMNGDDPGAGDNEFHQYPNHFYNPFKISGYHTCEASNLCLPAESYNNITVGAIADNMIPGPPVGLTPLKELPAYYTRKSPVDYSKLINGTAFSLKQMNPNLNKPDIVMPGGDLLQEAAAMQVVGFGLNANDFFIWESGTSLAAPLAANLAAKIIAKYPGLNMQSVKALILNNAKRLLAPEFLDGLIEEIRQEAAEDRFGKDYAALDKKEKGRVDEHYKSEILYKKLVGYGMPQVERTLASDSKSVTIILQDSIAIDFHKVINLNIPEYLLKFDKPSYILSLKATLCYKFLPVWNNQLGYNPLHISFNFIKSVAHDIPAKTAEIVADKQHAFYEPFTQGITDLQKKTKAKNAALAIKANMPSWSEDFFPSSTKPFSNTQQHEIKINKDEISKVGNQVSIVVRCTYKRDLDKAIIQQLMQSGHEFSIVINVEEKENDQLKKFDLYDELVACNVMEVINTATVDLETDLEA